MARRILSADAHTAACPGRGGGSAVSASRTGRGAARAVSASCPGRAAARAQRVVRRRPGTDVFLICKQSASGPRIGGAPFRCASRCAASGARGGEWRDALRRIRGRRPKMARRILSADAHIAACPGRGGGSAVSASRPGRSGGSAVSASRPGRAAAGAVSASCPGRAAARAQRVVRRRPGTHSSCIPFGPRIGGAPFRCAPRCAASGARGGGAAMRCAASRALTLTA
jgi:hypothetical protein